MTAAFLSRAELSAMVEALLASGAQVLAPAVSADHPGATDYRRVSSLSEASLDGPLPRRSLKEFFLPPSEVVLRYRRGKEGVALEEVGTLLPRRVILGARPCDAAGVLTLDAVMAWGHKDEPWFARREATTIVSLACPGADEACFCSALGLGPDAARGSDLLLVPVAGGYLAEASTAKGEALLGNAPREVTARTGEEALAFRRAARERVAKNLPAVPKGLASWLEAHFDDPLWKTLALGCHGCGACASVCPTCHCFDLVDEHDRLEEGARRRNWDTCQSAKFTLHASGHNPRPTQVERYRQRILHKFAVYPKRFGETLCTGCGRCARACAAGVHLPEILGRLSALAGGEPREGAR